MASSVPSLPLELAQHIISFVCDAADLVACARVCDSWRTLADSNHLWYRLAVHRFPRVVAISKALRLDLEAGGAKRAFQQQLASEVRPSDQAAPPAPTPQDFLLTVELYWIDTGEMAQPSWTGPLDGGGLKFWDSVEHAPQWNRDLQESADAGWDSRLGLRIWVSRATREGLRTIK
eukprot:6763610-Prymnesium_polylepis.1